MGAEASRSSSRSNTLHPSQRRSKSSLIAKWQKRQLSTQLFAVVRHAERADGIYAFIDGMRWTITEDSRRWPLDPPLSDVGLDQAQEMGRYLEDYAQEQDSVIHVVISSPYFRCIQTAVLICASLGPRVRLLVDRSLGEVYGPSVMGGTEPCNPIRDPEHTKAFCNLHGVSCQSRVIGRWPVWPEQLRDARRRYALRFFSYLQRSVTTRRNFILVAHGDAVGAVLSTMPSVMHQVVEKVEYGGLFVAKRTRSDKVPKERRRSSGNMSSVLPVEEERAGTDAEEQSADLDMAEVDLREFRGQTLRDNLMGEDSLLEHAQHAPKASESWQVDLHGVTMREREGAAKFQRRLKTLAAQSELSSKKIERLLGELGDQPLGDDMQQAQSAPARSLTDRMVPSCCSVSTYLFGASDAGGERDFSSRDFDICSDLGSDCGSHRGEVPTSMSLLSVESEARHSARGPSGSGPLSPYLRPRHPRPSHSGRGNLVRDVPQRAVTLQALVERGTQEQAPTQPPSAVREEEPAAGGAEHRGHCATTLLPVMESQPPSPEPAKRLGGMENSLLMRRRRLQSKAENAGVASVDAGAVRLLPTATPNSTDFAEALQVELAVPWPGRSASQARSVQPARLSSHSSSPSTPSSPSSPHPSEPARVEARCPEEATAPSQASQGGKREAAVTERPAAVVFGGLDGSALLQRRRQARGA